MEPLMTQKPDRDIAKDYPLPEFIEKLRRLADALEQGRRFEIQLAGSGSRFRLEPPTTSITKEAKARKRSNSRSSGPRRS
jgi:hypothetical protein